MSSPTTAGSAELTDKSTCLPKENRDGDKEFEMLMLDGYVILDLISFDQFLRGSDHTDTEPGLYGELCGIQIASTLREQAKRLSSIQYRLWRLIV